MYIKTMTNISGNKNYPTSAMIQVKYNYNDKNTVITRYFPSIPGTHIVQNICL